MRKILLTTVAAAALTGFAGAASAQTTQGPATGGAANSQSTERQSPGTMGGALKGNINGPGANKAAQTPTQGAKPDQRMGQDEQKQTTPQRGAEEQKAGSQEQQGAQEEKSGAQQQRGAEEEKNGAGEQRGAQEENTKSNGNTGERNASETKGSSGAAVQLSQAQRTKIKTIIGRSHAPHVATNAHFSVEVGVKVPRTVHVEVLPADIVEIVPQFRGFDYVVVGDNILIIDPDTLEIVDIIPA